MDQMVMFQVLLPCHPKISIVLVLVLALSCFAAFGSGAGVLPAEEVDALKEIGKALGKNNWNTADPCSGESSWVNTTVTKVFENVVTCNCTYQNSTVCHIVNIRLRGQNLEGFLPPELIKLRYLQEIELSRNLLSGTIPKEWGVMPELMNISLLGNRLSGEIPEELGNITTLTELNLEANNFSGSLPPKLGDLVNIERILISSNAFSGELPLELANLTSLKDFRISDNHFIGKIPDFIQNWTLLEKLQIQGSGLQGPIPSGISLLKNLIDLRISDINGTTSAFPSLINMTKLKSRLILRNCNLTGPIPPYIGAMANLRTLDLSFNKLVGPIPDAFNKLVESADFIYLTSNLLTGAVPNSMKGSFIDLSYNNFSLEGSGQCKQNNLNLFGSSPTVNNLSGAGPCLKNFSCPKSLLHSLHINCGGNKVIINGTTTFNEDQDGGSAAKFVLSRDNWVFSSTGYFMDDNKDDSYITSNISILSMPDFELYTRARLSPLSLTYYGLCLRNGNYTVKLHFAEIMFTDDRTYKSLGRRIFDVYIQGNLVLKDFNIEDEAGGAHKKVVKNFTAVVTTNTLEIRFYWAGKGTMSIPTRGTYGPLISAISVEPDFKVGGKNISVGVVVGIVAAVLCAMFLILCLLWWKGCFAKKPAVYEGLRRLDLQTGSFTLRQIKAATNNFDAANKIGEGGFGPVYKGLLSDGTVIAVKQLSSKSKQGNREFLNEIGMISALQHPNLVKLYGCCIEGDQLLLVYEYMENNCLARALFGSDNQQLDLDWPTRQRICIGIARGLAYLHEESRLKIVHRDIKATNVLLDKDLNPKISDFGLAKLDEEDNTHIITRIAGTLGYMAPEYAMRGYLTDKADVYSFGIVALEIVSGESNTSYRSKEDCDCLLEWAHILQERGSLMELVDPKLGSEFKKEAVMGMLTVALLCTSNSPTLRPSMSAVVSMLEGRTAIQNLISDPNLSSDDSRFKATRNHHQQIYSQEHSQSQSISMDGTWTPSPHDIDSGYSNGRE